MTVLPAFTINGINLPSPSDHGWQIPSEKGDNGNGQKQYTPYFTYELIWSELTQSEYYTINRIWKGHYNSGTASVSLPQFDAPTDYGFITYTGVILDRPTVGKYTENYIRDVKLTIRKILA